MKKSIFLKSALGLIGLVSLLAFTRPFGGDSIRVYLDKQLVFEQFVHADKKVHNLSLQDADRNKNLEIQYRHCGVSGKERTLALKAGNRELKKWKFANASSSNTGIVVPVKEVWEAAKKENSKISLVYSSKEIPEGKVIAGLQLGAPALAKN